MREIVRNMIRPNPVRSIGSIRTAWNSRCWTISACSSRAA